MPPGDAQAVRAPEDGATGPDAVSMIILVTNDDGVFAPALRKLRNALDALGRVVIVAPDRDQGATSHR